MNSIIFSAETILLNFSSRLTTIFVSYFSQDFVDITVLFKFRLSKLDSDRRMFYSLITSPLTNDTKLLDTKCNSKKN